MSSLLKPLWLVSSALALTNVSNFTRRSILAEGGWAPATNYDTSPAPGACGIQNSNLDWIVALNPLQFSQSLCGKRVQLTVESSGLSFLAQVADSCGYGGTCQVQSGIDTSNALFAALGGDISGDLAVASGFGNVPVKWTIFDEVFSAQAGGALPQGGQLSQPVVTTILATSTSAVIKGEIKQKVQKSSSARVTVIQTSQRAQSTNWTTAPPTGIMSSVGVSTSSRGPECEDGQIECSDDSLEWSQCADGSMVSMGSLAAGQTCSGIFPHNPNLAKATAQVLNNNGTRVSLSSPSLTQSTVQLVDVGSNAIRSQVPGSLLVFLLLCVWFS